MARRQTSRDDGGSGVGPPDADMEEAAPMAESDLALVVDDVAADAVVVIELAVGARGSLGQGVVDGGRGGAVGQRAMVSGPASRTWLARSRRSWQINPTVVWGMAVGELLGRRERGSKAASPSRRKRATRRLIQLWETP